MVEEEVSLQVIVKNINLLQIRVFEFNTETYYKKNLKPFDTTVNLDGLEAAETFSHNYSQEPNILHRETFKFANLKDKVGLFIVEMMGNGVSARSVIKKGSLSMVQRSTIAGHQIYLLDQNKQVCAGEKTGVWFDSKYYPCDKDQGRIFIPYSKVQTSRSIIMIHNDFA